MLKKSSAIFVFVLIFFSWAYSLAAQDEPHGNYVESHSKKLTDIRKDLDAHINALKKKGEYRCCIASECKWCAIYMGHCNCEDMIIKEGIEYSCPECSAAWNKKNKLKPGDKGYIHTTDFGIYSNKPGQAKHSHAIPDDHINHSVTKHDHKKDAESESKKKKDDHAHDHHDHGAHH